jgi:hypothetical protein
MEKIMKKYKTSTAGSIILAIITVVILVVVISSTSKVDQWIPWFYLLLLLIATMDFKFGIYAGVQEDIFFEVKHFIYRKKIGIQDISTIMYKPTWIFGKNMKSIYIVDKKDGNVKIKMTNGAYTLVTLAKIVSDLKKRNLTIRLDDSAQELVEKYS